MTESLKRARELLRQVGGYQYEGQQFEQDARICAEVLDAWAQEARLEEARWWDEHCIAEDESQATAQASRIASLEQRK
jgi:hypothetical protein